MAAQKTSGSSAGAVVFTVGAVLFAGIAGMLLARLLGNKYSREPLRPVVVAARELRAGQPLAAADLQVRSWPVSTVPEGAFGAR